MKVVLLESLGIAAEKVEEKAAFLREAGHSFEAYERNMDEEVQIARASDADASIIANMPLSGRVIDACRNLKFIDVAFTGVDHVALEHAARRNIAVSNASGYSNEAVAELTLNMMLSLLRNVPQVEKRCREGKTKDGLVGCELRGKTVGIIGTGAIGSRVAEICHFFGCRVIAYSRHSKDSSFITYLPLEEILRQADIVTLHCPLNEETRGLISEEKIALMKKGAYLINSARGPVVDSEALAKALCEGKLAGAGIDVFEMEPPLDIKHPLLQAPNVIATPHVAFATKESMEVRADIVFNNLRSWMDGKQVNKIL